MNRIRRAAGVVIWAALAVAIFVLVYFALQPTSAVPSVAILSIAGLGLVCLVLLWWVVRSYRRQSDDMRRLGLIDPLSGLGNEAAFAETLRAEVSRAARHDFPLSLALLQIDNHADSALADLTRSALGSLLAEGRKEDRAFRISTDTFALILPYATFATASAAVDRLLQGAAQRLFGAKLSVGVATQANGDPDALLQQALHALTAAHGGNPPTGIAAVRVDRMRGSA